ncbi:DUF3152 domain-containing protein [Streptomyces paromomycinus]|uniref:DUF3152 domain-containing protein n=1 Tax=Streptomyces paromomycinus TaxID=92743 RepID=UPI001FE317E0|nr:DUF3152 domain-containing protein [Streptomyces paromomycinus]
MGEADGLGAAGGAGPVPGPGTGRRRRRAEPGPDGGGGGEAARAGGAEQQRTPGDEPAQGAIRYATGRRTPEHGPAQGAPWQTPAQRTPQHPSTRPEPYRHPTVRPAAPQNAPARDTSPGTPARDTSPGTPAHGTPAQGAPRVPRPRDGRPQSAPATPAHGFAPFEDGGEGASRPAPGAGGTAAASTPAAAPAPDAEAGPVLGPTSTGTGSVGSPFVPQNRVPAPRQEYIDAFAAQPVPEKERVGGPGDADDDVFAAGSPESGGRPGRAGPGRDTGRSVVFPREGDGPADAPDITPDAGELGAQGPQFSSRKKITKGRTFTGVAAAAVTTVLAVVVAGQVTDQRQDDGKARALSGKGRTAGSDAASRSNARPTQQAAPVTYDDKMAKAYPLDTKLAASGQFKPAGGDAEAPGRGKVWRYRVDVEEGMGLDGELFADAVHKTLNDDRSWAHGGRRTFERVGSGEADFVITLASPGTTAAWCAKSGLDTTEDNVSCDSAATERVMINAYRWAQGAQTYGPDQLHAYRQMLINHEVGHRLGRNHESCTRQGALAPVMMQQTKFLTTDGATCRPNAWPFPEGR